MTAVETLTGIFEKTLGVPVAPDDDFFDLGGYSLLVVDIVDQAKAAGLALRAADVFKNPTPAGLAAHIGFNDDHQLADARFHPDMVARVWRDSVSPFDPTVPPSLIPLTPSGDGEPLFCVHTGNGHVRMFTDITTDVGFGRPVYGLESIGYRARVRPFLSIHETAGRYVDEIRTVQATGPYHLTGLCAGGIVALEMAQRLTAAGDRVASLVLIDPPSGMPELDAGWGVNEYFDYLLGSLKTRFGLHDPIADLPAVLPKLKDRLWFEPDTQIDDFYRLTVLWAAALFAQEHYEPRPYPGRVAIVTPRERAEKTYRYWAPMFSDITVDLAEYATLQSILAEPVVPQVFAKHLGPPS